MGYFEGNDQKGEGQHLPASKKETLNQETDNLVFLPEINFFKLYGKSPDTWKLNNTFLNSPWGKCKIKP